MLQDKEILHPFEDDLSFYTELYLLIILNKCLVMIVKCMCFAEGEVDRCPTGSGVSGRMAIHKARKEIDFNQVMSIESITGSTFKGSVISKKIMEHLKL